MPFVECERCGYRWDATNARKNVARCASCRARPARTIVDEDGERCRPWRGMFAKDEVTPVDDNGEPILPGFRVCGNMDCVNPDHVREWKW